MQVAYAAWREAEVHLRGNARQAALAAAEAARSGAAAVSAAHLERAVGDLLGRFGGPSTATDQPLPFRLTPREAQVLRLVAVGRSDRAIAAELFLSHRTVERHVSNILAKLSVTSRSEATAVAHAQRLLS
jgi:DNA-binding NarL/FixJ family response regulator